VRSVCPNVCSSGAFLIHKWMAILASNKVVEPGFPGDAVVCLQEKKRRMQLRFSWVLAVTALLSAALLVSCSAKYSSTSNGLVVVSTQGSAVMDMFSLDLGNGHMTQIYDSAGPPTNGVPTTVVLAPGGAYAYVLVTQSVDVTASKTGIETFSVASDGKLAPVGTTTLNPMKSTPVTPTAMVIDSAGKFLFVADVSPATGVPGSISVFAVGSSGGLTEVTGSPFALASEAGGTTPSASALAISPTVYPPAYSICSGNVPPTTENLYVTDSVNYFVLNYSVSSSGALTVVPATNLTPGYATGTNPTGVAVDPCNRFVYVANGQPSNNVSAFTVCNTVTLPTCPNANFSLLPVSGSPFTAGPGPVALTVDPLGNFLYVLDQQENAIRPYGISSSTGTLTALTPTYSGSNQFPTSIAIRSDDTWMFVTNLNSASLSQYAITPSTGGLTTQPPVQTDNNPWGVAVR
jgi:6-phosphogluconolactonase (cycloisomerase 2 family)